MTGYLLYPLLFCGFRLLFSAAELMRPARPLNYRAVIKDDLVALAIYGLLFLPASIYREWILLTPRYHHIHHSRNPEHHGANLGSRPTIWDRLFGTYVDPEGVGEISFGIEAAPSPTRLALGI